MAVEQVNSDHGLVERFIRALDDLIVDMFYKSALNSALHTCFKNC